MVVPEQMASALPAYRQVASGLREALLANLTLIGETPAPTFGERERATMVAERFAAAGLQSCIVDGVDNASALLPGASGAPALLVAAHMDTLDDDTPPGIELRSDRVLGPFVGDNAISLAAMATLPLLLERLDIRLRSGVVFLASARTLGRGNLAGVRSFLSESTTRFQRGLCLESFQLGRLNHMSIGMLRGEITCRLPDDYDWAQFGSTGTVIPMAEIIQRISCIPVPQRPLTTIILGSVHGGISPGNVARETMLAFEVRSESADILRGIHETIEDICEAVAAQSGKRVALDVYAQRDPGGLDIGHSMVRRGRAILTALGLQPALYATTSMMAALRDAGIPALTIGVTTGERRSELEEIDEYADIPPMADGLAQLALLLQAMDEEVA